MTVTVIGLVAALCVGLFATPLVAEAQQPGKVYRVGTLGDKSSDPAEARLWQALRLSLRERGWTEGGNILFEPRWAEGDVARLPELAADLVRLKVDLIVARSSTHVRAAKAVTSSIPIVFVVHADPVGTGHVASLARPGGNITGLSLVLIDIYSKELDLLTSAVPGAKRIAVLWSPDNPTHTLGLKALDGAARTLGVQLQPVSARTGADLEAAFAAMARARAQALMILVTPAFLTERQRLAELAIAQRLPTMFAVREGAEAGLLMSYGAEYLDLFQRAAIYVDKILRGAKPGELPVEQATKFELVINAKTVKSIGLTIPQSLLQRADQVIE